jgi:hypothetical protein
MLRVKFVSTYFSVVSINDSPCFASSRAKVESVRCSSAKNRGLSEGFSSRYSSKDSLVGELTSVFLRWCTVWLYSISEIVNWLTLFVVVSRRIDGMTVSIMASKVVHCSAEKGNSAGPSGGGVARGARASASVVAMLIAESMVGWWGLKIAGSLGWREQRRRRRH